jgi:integrase
MGKLTDVQIRHWIKAKTPVAKTDGDGLTFTLSSGGTAAWVLRYRLGGKQRELTLGRWQDLSLRKARELATEARAKVQQGVDVGREKQRQKYEAVFAWTFKQLAADYETKVLPGLAAGTGIAFKQKAKTHVLPAIGHLAAHDITGADIVQMLDKVTAKSPRLVKGVLSITSLVFSHGMAKQIVTANPCAGIRAQAIAGDAKIEPARVMLTDAELKAMLPALKQYGRINELTVRILLGTGVRIRALTLAEWPHIDREKREWLIPAGDGRKSGRAFVVPLTDAVAGYFEELRSLAGHSRFVLPITKRRAGREGDAPMSAQAINQMLWRLCAALPKIRKFSPHDLRSTCRSHLAALGVSVVVAERCLNHTLGGLVAVYDQHDYLDERRKALELWEAKLATIESGADNVVMLRGAA